MAEPPFAERGPASPWAVQLLRISIGVAIGAVLLLLATCILA